MMKRALVRMGISVICCVSLSTALTAQDSCVPLMQFGIYDQYDTLATQSEFRLLKSWLCESDSYEQASATSGKAGIDIAGLLGISAGASDQEKQSKYHNFCSSTFDQVQNDTSLTQHIRSISPAMMSLLKHCLDVQQTGFAAWIDTTADRTFFSYFARYRPNGDERATIRSFDIEPATERVACQRVSSYRLFARGRKVGNSPIALTCPVDPKTTVVVTIVADKGGPDTSPFVRTLDGVQPDPPHSTTVTQNYRVDAAGYSTAHQWLDTGLSLPAQTDLTISATGTGCLIQGDCYGPDGSPNANPQCAAAGIVCGALMAKIGGAGQPFFVGSNFHTVIPEGGVLFLGYADIDWANNSGFFAVTVTAVEPPPSIRALHRIPSKVRIFNTNR